jgi:hypothetical protein
MIATGKIDVALGSIARVAVIDTTNQYYLCNNAKTEIARYGEVKAELIKISGVYSERELCNRLISAVHIATTYQ